MVGSKEFALNSSFQVVTGEVAGCGGDQGVKQMEAGGKKMSKQQRRLLSGRETTQIQ